MSQEIKEDYKKELRLFLMMILKDAQSIEIVSKYSKMDEYLRIEKYFDEVGLRRLTEETAPGKPSRINVSFKSTLGELMGVN